MKPIQIILRNGYYYIRRRVPARYKAVDPRTIVQLCLFTDSLTAAQKKAPIVWEEMVEAWEAKLSGKDADGEARLKAAREIAHRRQWRYMDAASVAQLPLQEVIARVNAVRDGAGRIDMAIADAALGLPNKSAIKVSEAVKEFYEVAGERILGKSEDQLRRHKNPRQKATRNFIAAVSDKAISELTSEDMFAFRKWLTKRVEVGEVTAESANKDMTYLLAMWKPVAQSKGFKLGFVTDGLMLRTAKKTKARTRPPFSAAWIKDKILAPGALAKLNADARLILLGMVNTGYRPSEGGGLMPHEIVLDAEIPHIIIQPNQNRTLKNEQSERILPLTGISLEAFKEARIGFPRYAADSATLSGTVNKFLTENGLLESDRHSFYSLRHSMEDRMLRAGIDERIRMDILGHQISRERYGEGGGLSHVHGLLENIAL